MEFYESFMKFRFADDDVFCIQDDPLVIQSTQIKACECVAYLHPKVALIEAKSSSPKEIVGSSFLNKIKHKFEDTLRVFNGIRNKEYGLEAYRRLPVNLRDATIVPKDYRVCLIIHGHRLDWLNGLHDALQVSMHDILKEWHIPDSNIKVYNEELALEDKLIVAFVPRDERDALRETQGPNGNMSKEKAKAWFEDHSI